METGFVVYSMPHTESGFKGLTKGTQKHELAALFT